MDALKLETLAGFNVLFSPGNTGSVIITIFDPDDEEYEGTGVYLPPGEVKRLGEWLNAF